MKLYINEGIENYISGNKYPWHMPGHKRNSSLDPMFGKDFTEVKGLDDLHHPEEMILNSMNELTRVYGTYKSYYLVNGSTCGLLAAVMACCKLTADRFHERTAEEASYIPGENAHKLLIAANCHKSVFNAAELAGNSYEIFSPKKDDATGIYGSINPEELKEFIEEKKQDGIFFSTFVMTSPTYEGILSDVASVKRVLVDYGIKLVVDEAHGAHLPFADKFGKSAICGGADVVVESLHKTLPSLTQTAVLHIVNEDEALKNYIEKYLSVFMSSSPSYIFLANMEKCVAWCDGNRSEFDTFYERVMDFRKKITEASLGHIKLLEEYVQDEKSGNFYKDAAGTDPSRLTFIIDGVSGREAMDILDGRFNMVFEMAGRKHIVAIATVMDDEAAFSALYEAIVGLDDIIEKCFSDEFQIKYSKKNDAPEDYIIDTESGKKSLVNAVGMTSKNTVYVYPPGIPFIHSGDMINKEMLSEIKRELENGGRLRFQ